MLRAQEKFVHDTKDLVSIRKNNFTNNARYNYEKMKFIMPVDTIFVTILKDPVFLIESLFPYYNLREIHREKSANHFTERLFSTFSNKSAHHNSFNKEISERFERNQMSINLGLDVKHFDNLEMIRKFINTIDSRFHLVMIADRMEESLILLQHLLCWTLDDMIVFRPNVRNAHLSRNLSIGLKQKIRYFTNADELLYKYFSAKLTRQTEAFGKKEMEKQIISLQHKTKLMYDKCIEQGVPITHLESSNHQSSSYRVLSSNQSNNAYKKCRDFITSELRYKNFLRKKQRLQNDAFGIHAKSKNIKV